MPTHFAFDLRSGVPKHVEDGLECNVVHVDDVIALEGVGGQVLLHDSFDAVTGVAVVEKVVDSAIFHLRYVCGEPEHAGERGVRVVKVEGLFRGFQDTGMAGVNASEGANVPVAGDGKGKFELYGDCLADLGDALVAKDAEVGDLLLDVLVKGVGALENGEFFDSVGVVAVGLFLEVLDEGRLVVDKLACKDDKVLFQEGFEVGFVEVEGGKGFLHGDELVGMGGDTGESFFLGKYLRVWVERC